MQIEDLAPFMNLLIIVHLFLLKTSSFGFLLILFSAKLYLFVTGNEIQFEIYKKFEKYSEIDFDTN